MTRPGVGRAALALLAAALLGLAGFGCGRERPGAKDLAPVGTDAPGETGGFEDVGGLEGELPAAGTAGGVRLLRVASQGFALEEPALELTIREADAEGALGLLCRGEAKIAVVEGGASGACGERKAGFVDFQVARAEGKPVRLYVSRETLAKFEVEGFVQYAIDNGETLPGKAGFDPLSLDELQETQTELEQVIAGVR